MKKRILTLAMALLLAFAAPFMLLQAEEVEGGTLITSISADPTSFNPDWKADDNLWPIAQNIYNRLIKLNNNDEMIPDLAKDYEFSEDGLTLTFNLHEGVKWHDGEDFSADDVVWTYTTMMEEAWFKSDVLQGVESIEAPDDKTVVFNLEYPNVAIISKLGWYGTFILPKHLYEGTDLDTNPANQNPVGTGPFKFESFESGVAVTLVRNEDFFGPTAKLEKVIFSIIPDQNTAYQSFINGEIDYLGTGVPTANIDDLDDNEDYRLYPELWQNRSYLTFNFEDERFQDVRVRQAIAMAMDQEGMQERAGGGGSLPAKTMISPLQTEFVDESITMPERDLEGAKALLEEAGYEADANGVYMNLTLDTFSSFEDLAAVVQANLREAGIEVTLNVMEYAAWSDKVKDAMNFELTMLAGYQGPDVSGVNARVRTDGSSNIGKYSNPELDALLDQGIQVSDVEERREIYVQVQQIMKDDMPIVLLIDNGGKFPIPNYLQDTPHERLEDAASSEFTYTYFVE